jgi:superfamily II RNA helicase
VLTDFQHELWTRLRDRRRVAIAAPTSAGKSFVLQSFLTSLFDQPEARSVL